MCDMDEFSFGVWLQRRRRAFDMTQAELGRRVGIAAATIRKIEADARHPSTQVAERLADTLAIPPTGRVLFVRAARGEQARLHDLAALERIEPRDRGHAQAGFQLPTDPAAEPLPVPLTPLIGRTALVAAVHELLGRQACA
jgi:transcriptional regulator with XRE-family HTH domain